MGLTLLKQDGEQTRIQTKYGLVYRPIADMTVVIQNNPDPLHPHIENYLSGLGFCERVYLVHYSPILG
jgi:hypothetical protein